MQPMKASDVLKEGIYMTYSSHYRMTDLKLSTCGAWLCPSFSFYRSFDTGGNATAGHLEVREKEKKLKLTYAPEDSADEE